MKKKKLIKNTFKVLMSTRLIKPAKNGSAQRSADNKIGLCAFETESVQNS